VLPPVHRWMLRTVLKACSQIDVSTLEWGRLLGRYRNVTPEAIHWAPVPSNIPVADDPDAVAGLRRRLAPRGEQIIGHFGTFSAYQSRWLRDTLPPLLRDRPDRVGLLTGRNGERLAATIAADCPVLEGRLAATGSLDPAAISHHLQACDLLIQPYPDGICSRRTTAMAGLVHSRPVVATRGGFTEPVWTEGTSLSPIESGPEGLVQLADRVLNDPEALNRLGVEGRALYERHFALEHTLDALDGSSMLTPHRP
jgi:glycosyltransferase involved in cell wall biosynthesis